MRVKKKLTWLLLLLRLPATHKAERVAIWRKLKKSGAIQIQTSTYVLPDEPARYESFQWLTQEVRSVGGDATLVRAREIEGLPNEKLIELFNTARAKEYATLRELLRALSHRRKTRSSPTFGDKLDRVRKQFREIRQTDFFNCPRAQDVEMLLRKMEGTQPGEASVPRVVTRDYRGRTWVTRPRPEIDRVGSAWLIRKFIDPKAKFIFAKKIPANGRVVSFDMLEADFSHQGDDCTFETLMKHFKLRDKRLEEIAQIIHDGDLEDNKFGRPEGKAIELITKGWGKMNWNDEEILRKGFELFDALYLTVGT